MSAALDVAALVQDPQTRVIVTCGSGGVGKTTTAAAMALLGAEAGRRTVVLTIDPARRLAQSMGLTELDNTPREVVGAKGELFAMMLDMKRTFDEVVLEASTPDRAEQIFANPFYQSLSSSFAGTQEYMAMEKLGQLVAADEWDLIVVDTPPSRSALDFLDAPNRLGRFLDGRMVRLLTAPAKAGGKAYLKVVTVSVGVVARVFTKVIGGDLLNDLSTFVSALESMFGGFRERAQQTYDLLEAARHVLRGRGHSRAGRAARGVLLRGAAVRGAHAARRRDRQPHPGARTGQGREAADGGTGRGRRRRARRGR